VLLIVKVSEVIDEVTSAKDAVTPAGTEDADRVTLLVS
jgi:hypothetical protein